MSHVLTDIRLALRQMRRSPGFTAIAVLALALGIGANSAIFTVVDAVLVRPLPFPEADRLMAVYEDVSHMGFAKNTPAPANWVDWRQQNTVFTDIAATRGRSKTLTGGGTPEQLRGRGVTASLWPLLGVQPRSGRVFTEEEDRKGERVVVISHGLWQRRFGAEPSVVGTDIWLSDEKYRVIGVMPQGFFFPSRQMDIWVPISFTKQDLARRGSHFLKLACPTEARSDAGAGAGRYARIAKQLEQAYPESNTKIGAVVEPLRDQMVGKDEDRTLGAAGGGGVRPADRLCQHRQPAAGAGGGPATGVRRAGGAGRGALAHPGAVDDRESAAGGAGSRYGARRGAAEYGGLAEADPGLTAGAAADGGPAGAAVHAGADGADRHPFGAAPGLAVARRTCMTR